ncbi:DUF494 family protein [candidate division KSB1 bacterium]|nr:DUF494 family protein [candidate division KSB1 bacterium]
MNERVVEILIYLMHEIRQKRGNIELMDGISKDLIGKGYTENEINAAFSWLFERFKSDSEDILVNEEADVNSYRMLSDIERLVVSSKAFGYLIQLRQLRLIEQSQMEQIIERVMMLGVSSIGIEEIKTVVAALFLNSDNSEMLPLGKSMLDPDSMIH